MFAHKQSPAKPKAVDRDAHSFKGRTHFDAREEAVFEGRRGDTSSANQTVADGSAPINHFTWNHLAWNLSQISMHAPVAGVQTKLSVNHAGDAYEREADHIAERVMGMHTLSAQAEPAFLSAPPSVQRKCACGGTCSKCNSAAADHDDDAHVSEAIQRKANATGSTLSHATAAPSIVHDVLCSPGRPLDTATRAFMEPRFGHDFSHVRIHTGPAAAKSAEAIFARAFTGGRHIVFGAGHYRPETKEGQQLLAHELAHVLQQGSHATAIQRAPDKQWVNDITAARYRGKILAERIRKHGKVSEDVKAKFASELQYFQGAAHEAYRDVVESAIRTVTPTEMPAMDMAPPPAPAPAPPPEPPKEKPKACTKLPDAGSGKKCKFFVYDSTLSDALGKLWKTAAFADAAFRPATYVVPSGESMELLLENILNAYAEKDCDCTDEIQFWSHGSSGNGGWISSTVKGGTSQLTAGSFNIPGVDKYGDDRRKPGYQEWEDKLTPFQRRLMLVRRTICDADSTVYYRSCQGFQGQTGKEFAKASSDFFRCDVSGHTKNIGLTQPGKHTLSPCENPDWSDSEGVGEASKKDKQKLTHVKPQ